MATKLKRKVLVIAGNPMELGQALTTLFELNPDIKIHNNFVGNSIRETKPSGIFTPGQNSTFEPITVLYLVYDNPVELKGFDIQTVGDIKGKVKNLPN